MTCVSRSASPRTTRGGGVEDPTAVAQMDGVREERLQELVQAQVLQPEEALVAGFASVSRPETSRFIRSISSSTTWWASRHISGVTSPMLSRTSRWPLTMESGVRSSWEAS